MKRFEGRRRYRHSERGLSAFEKGILIVGACIGITTAVIMYFQLRSMNRQLGLMAGQLDEMKSTSRQTDDLIKTSQTSNALAAQSNDVANRALTNSQKANDLTQQAIRVSKDSVGVSKDSLRVSQRPWINAAKIELQVKPLERLEATVTFKNVGQSPALNVKTHVLEDVKERLELSDFDKRESLGVQSTSIIGRDQTVSSVFNCGPFSQAVVDQLVFPPPYLFVYGRVAYSDQFGMKHETLFCYYYDSKTWRFCDTFNSGN